MTFKSALCKIILMIVILGNSSCTKEYDSEGLIDDLVKGKSSKVIASFYRPDRLEKNDLKTVIDEYSKKIQSNGYEKVAFKEFVNFRRKDREGYMFIDTNNNIVSSITYKFILNSRGNKRINFIDFRSSTEDLPCIKFPTNFPIKCILIPMRPPEMKDSLRKIYPKEILGYKVYHNLLRSKKYLKEQGDTLKKALLFNSGNLKIQRNLEKILIGLDDRVNLNDYTLAEYHYHGEPRTNLIYDPKHYSSEEVNSIRQVIEEVLQEEIQLRASKTIRGTQETLSIGGTFSKARVSF